MVIPESVILRGEDEMNDELVRQLTTSLKIKIPLERLKEIVGTEAVYSDVLIPSLLIEVSSVTEFEASMSREQIATQGLTILGDVFPNPVVKGSFAIGQLLKLIELDCVLSIEEDVELQIEETQGQSPQPEGERDDLH